MRKKCTECGNNKPLGQFSNNAAGVPRAKCDMCLQKMQPTHRLQQAKPAPKEGEPLPKIVASALLNQLQGDPDPYDSRHNKRATVAKKLLNVPPIILFKCYVCQVEQPNVEYTQHEMEMSDGNNGTYRETTCKTCMEKIRAREAAEKDKKRRK